ncbi:MAG: hypothetical protein IJO91_10910 [Oscillospiraceae bacterium]|nr:hypothetical protein [Oscillospiraceae bacterium]
MKLQRKALLSAAAVTALFAMGGCGKNELTGAYGPPPDEYNTDSLVADCLTEEDTDITEKEER